MKVKQRNQTSSFC